MDLGITDSQIVSRCARTTSLPHPGETSRDADVILRPDPSSRPPGPVLPTSRIGPIGVRERSGTPCRPI